VSWYGLLDDCRNLKDSQAIEEFGEGFSWFQGRESVGGPLKEEEGEKDGSILPKGGSGIWLKIQRPSAL